MTPIHNRGAYPTMITPYRADGQVDLGVVRAYVHWYYDHACDGIFSVCQSSEITSLSAAERATINKTVYDTVQTIAETGGRRMTVVSSGHTAASFDEQVRELQMIYDSGTDALILITNRLDPANEGDDVWLHNAERLLQSLPEDAALGLYECPLPYKRLLTPRILRWCLGTGRFRFIKDTCCDIKKIEERLHVLRGSTLMLFNANCQTLLASLRAGAAGYCGVMCNMHPQLYSWLCRHYAEDAAAAEILQALLGTFGFTEGGLPYPLTAKYHMCLEGIPTELTARSRDAAELTAYAMDCVRQMRTFTKYFEQQYGEEQTR